MCYCKRPANLTNITCAISKDILTFKEPLSWFGLATLGGIDFSDWGPCLLWNNVPPISWDTDKVPPCSGISSMVCFSLYIILEVKEAKKLDRSIGLTYYSSVLCIACKHHCNLATIPIFIFSIPIVVFSGKDIRHIFLLSIKWYTLYFAVDPPTAFVLLHIKWL